MASEILMNHRSWLKIPSFSSQTQGHHFQQHQEAGLPCSQCPVLLHMLNRSLKEPHLFMWKRLCWLLTCNGTCDTGLKQISKYRNFLLRRQGWGRGHGNYMFSMSAAFLFLPKAALEKAFLIVYFSFALPSLLPSTNSPIEKVCHSFHGIQQQWGDNRIHGWWMMIWDALLEILTCVLWHQQYSEAKAQCRVALTSHIFLEDMLLSSFSFSKLSSFTTSEKMWRGGKLSAGSILCRMGRVERRTPVMNGDFLLSKKQENLPQHLVVIWAMSKGTLVPPGPKASSPKSSFDSTCFASGSTGIMWLHTGTVWVPLPLPGPAGLDTLADLALPVRPLSTMVHGSGEGSGEPEEKLQCTSTAKWTCEWTVCCTMLEQNGTETHLFGNEQQPQRPQCLAVIFP